MFNNYWGKALLFLLLVSTASADHDSYMRRTAVLDGKLYITTSYYSSGSQQSKLWSYDGSTMTELTALASSWVNHIQVVGSKLVIFMGNSTYMYDPSAASDSRLTTVVTGSNYYENFVTYDSKVYFTYYSSGSYYLQSFDGSSLSTAVSLGSNWPQSMNAYNSKIYWLQGSSNYYLYHFDGTTVTNTNQYLSYYPQGRMAVLDNKLVIFANNQVYSYDGTATSPTIAYKADSGGYPNSPTVVGDRVYFGMYSSTSSKYSLKYFDGSSVSSASSTALAGYINGMTSYMGRPIFYVWDSNASRYKLGSYYNGSLYNLASDTENDPPSKAADLVTTSTGTWLHSFYEYNGTLYWMRDQGALWKYNIATIEFSSGYPFSYNVSSTSLDLAVKTDKDGKVYYVVLADGATAPTSAQVKAGTDASGTSSTSGNQTVSAEEAGRISISSGLSISTSYDIYVVAEDKSENLQSSPTKIEATTTSTALAVFASGYPSVTIASSGTSGTLKVKTDKLSHVYYIVLADGTTAPTSAQVKNEADGSANVLSDVAKGSNNSVEADTETSLTISGLTASTEYDLWVVLEYDHTLPSSPTLVEISTDKTAPTVASGYPSSSNIGQTDLTLAVKVNENSTAYFVVLADGATRPDTTEIINGQDGSGATSGVKASGNIALKANTENSQSITGLTAGTKYDIWVAVRDGSSNGNITTAVKNDVETLAAPVVITVKTDGTGDHPSIQEAINSITSTTKQDTVEVYDGTYVENIDFGGRNIVVRSKNGPEKTIISPPSSGTWKAIVWFQNGEPSTAKLVGFTLKDGGNLADGSALNIEGESDPTIENCIITSSKKYAIRLQDSGSKIVNTLIYGNTGDGIFKFDTYTTTNYPSIINCTIADNNGYGLENFKSYQPTVTNSIIYGNSSGGALGNFAMTYSIVEGGYSGTGNRNQYPAFISVTRTTTSDYKLSDYSPAIGTGTVVANVTPTIDLVSGSRGTPPDMGAYESSLSESLTDGDAPTMNYVRIGLTGDTQYVGSANKIPAHWNGADAASGIQKYEVAVDTSLTSTTGNIKGWTSVGIDTSFTIEGLSLVVSKNYYVMVRATDKVGNISDVKRSGAVQLDITKPTNGVVVQGTDSHMHWLADTSTVTASWSGFTDNAGAINEYEVLMFDKVNNTIIVDWTNVGSELTKTFTGLALVNNGRYSFKVRATDIAGNLSNEVESLEFQVDNEKPVVTTLVEGLSGDEKDLDWFSPDGEIVMNWTGTDNGEILHYEFAIGTTESTDDIIAWTIAANDSSDTTASDQFVEGKDYFTNLRAKDKADNVGNIYSSDGFRIDGAPPIVGEVNDGVADDVDFSESTTTMGVNWTGFVDNESGISHYLVSLGTTQGGEEVRQPVDVGNVKNYIFSNLYLEHGVTYYSSVSAVDSAGNESKIVSSNGFDADIYPGPPSVTESLPASETFLPLITDGKLVFHFSEPVENVDIEISSRGDFTSETFPYADSLVILLKAPLTSLDTIDVNLIHLTDESGRIAEDIPFTFYTELMGDYNHNSVIDAADLSILAGGWMDKDYTYELGPVTGEVPHFIPEVDGEYNLRDIMAFTRIWHWYYDRPQLLNLARVNLGDEIITELNENSITVTVPDNVVAGQIAFQLSDNQLSVTLPEEKTGDMILLGHTDIGLQQRVMDFAYLQGNGERNFVLPIEYGKNSSTIMLSYALYEKNGVVTGQGIKTIDITPVPTDFSLNQNYPNPFNPTTQIEYGLPVDGQVKLTVYDLLGQEVRSLVSGQDQSAGYHNIMWDARDNRGLTVSAGVYIYRLASRGEDGQKFSRTKKMVLLK